LEDQGVATETISERTQIYVHIRSIKWKAAIRQKDDADTRLAIPAEPKLDVALRFSAIGDSFAGLQ